MERPTEHGDSGRPASAHPAAAPPVGRTTFDTSRLLPVAVPAVVALLVIVNAWPGLMREVGYWDTGEFQTVLPLMGTAHPTGYPTYVLLGWLTNLLLAPIGEPAYRVSALSLLAVAVAAAATVALVRRLTGSTIIAVATGIGLATTSLVWQNATRADPHAIHLAFVAVLMLALVRWADGRADGLDRRSIDRRLVVAAIVFGLAAGNHSLVLLLVPPIGLYVLAVEPGILRRPRHIATCLLAAVGTMALVFLELPLRGGLVPALTAPIVYGEPATWDGFWYIALAEQFRGSLGDVLANLPKKGEDLLERLNEQFGLLALLLPPALIVTARRAPRYTLLTGSALLITLVFNQSYANADISRYYLGPILWIWTWVALLGAELVAFVGVLAAKPEASPGADAPAATARSSSPPSRAPRIEWLAAAIVAVVLLLPTAVELDARRDGADRSDEIGASAWLGETLPVLEEDAVIVSWWSTSTPLWYAQKVQGRIPSVFIVDDRTMLDLRLGRAPDVIRRYLAEDRPVYAIRLEGRDLDELKGQFAMELAASSGNTGVWRVLGPGVTP